MAGNKRILLITNSEPGQANVHLVVSQELLKQDATLDLHIASSAPLEKGVVNAVPGATFHKL
ncbi:uncharacterized protein ColSpa_00717 [Colletotrichum spaethianum]|uniref:Uncharacterized protein n=1 Tax=Colletotrichum spaethianum TaxID=700344 RepID=A0AA37P486_9PEZI|nr:uncharacterized protein ColSpa_00717 [Colletotrichum spaethianum]GKT40536.1 hypothetical protein ColSpa_00717 [Colletotrichum spaethianum]